MGAKEIAFFASGSVAEIVPAMNRPGDLDAALAVVQGDLDNDLQLVILCGGSYDGQVTAAPRPPRGPDTVRHGGSMGRPTQSNHGPKTATSVSTPKHCDLSSSRPSMSCHRGNARLSYCVMWKGSRPTRHAWRLGLQPVTNGSFFIEGELGYVRSSKPKSGPRTDAVAPTKGHGLSGGGRTRDRLSGGNSQTPRSTPVRVSPSGLPQLRLVR